MEQGLIPAPQAAAASCAFPAKRGLALVMVLVIAAVGILFGAGALLMFRYQCQMRIDRQHELEKVYAVRSALNYIGNYAEKINLEGTSFEYHTASERHLNLLVKPVKRIFPDFADVRHLDIRNDGGNGRVFRFPVDDQCKAEPDYEYGRSGTSSQSFGIENYYSNDKRYGLLFPRWSARRGAKWWVNIGMPGTGGWLHEKYGRRYFFETRNYVPGNEANDIIRLCIIRNVTNKFNSVGCRRGWPLSREGERAIVLEFRPLGRDISDANAVIAFSEYLYTAGATTIAANPITWRDNIPAVNDYVGIQIAGDRIAVFHSQKVSGDVDKMLKGWRFSPSVAQLTHKTYDYFENGCVRDSDGEIVESPDLRAVIEVEANADSRPLEETDEVGGQGGAEDGSNVNRNDFVTDFRVTPAYQFDVFLEHPDTVTNLATVAQRILLKETKVGHRKSEYAVRTYDTHGTEHKGFRKDEMDWARDPARRKDR